LNLKTTKTNRNKNNNKKQ